MHSISKFAIAPLPRPGRHSPSRLPSRWHTATNQSILPTHCEGHGTGPLNPETDHLKLANRMLERLTSGEMRNNGGMEANLQGRQLSAAHEKNVLARYESYSRRQASERSIRTDLNLTFRELYRMEQMKFGIIGPLHIYGPSNITLFLRGCADMRLNRKLDFNLRLAAHRKTLDYCYFLAERCARIPNYQNKVRATATISTYLKLHHLYLSSRYALKTISTYKTAAVKSWAKTRASRQAPTAPTGATMFYPDSKS